MPVRNGQALLCALPAGAARAGKSEYRRIRETPHRGRFPAMSECLKDESEESLAGMSASLTSLFEKLIQAVNLLHEVVKAAIRFGKFPQGPHKKSGRAGRPQEQGEMRKIAALDDRLRDRFHARAIPLPVPVIGGVFHRRKTIADTVTARINTDDLPIVRSAVPAYRRLRAAGN